MTEPRVRIEIGGNGVAEVALARAEKMNALDPAMFDALLDAIERIGCEARVRAVVLHGEGRAFCAGLDLASFEVAADADGQVPMGDLAARTHGDANRFQQVAWGWRTLPVPVIAAIHGAAFGGGLQIALGADLRLVRADAKLSAMEIRWGIVPDMAGFALLRGLVRDDVLRELVFSGRVVDGTEAVAIGLATRLCDDPLAEARAVAQRMAALGPEAVRAAKRLCNLAADATPAAGVLLAEAREQQRLLGSEQQREAVLAGLEKRAPRFVD